MKKDTKYLSMILVVAVLVFAGCQENKTSKAETKSIAATETKNNSAGSEKEKDTAGKKPDDSAMNDAEMKKMMTEDISDIDTSKPLSADEVNSKFKSDEAEFKDKKIAVTGKNSAYMTSSSVIITDRSAWRLEVVGEKDKNGVVCVSKEKPKDAIDKIQKKEMGKSAYLTVKGIARKTVDGLMSTRHVALEPCEVVKVEIK